METLLKSALKENIHSLQKLVKEKEDANLWLYSGDVGLLIYHYYQHIYNGNPNAETHLRNNLNMQLKNVEQYIYNFKFGYGIPGLAWVIQFLINENALEEGFNESLEEIDKHIAKALKWNYEDGLYDLFIGTIGKGMYYFQRLEYAKRTKNEDLQKYLETQLSAIVANIKKSAVIDKHGIYWLDHYTSLYNEYRNEEPYAGLGHSHGIPSIIYFLGKCFYYGIKKETCQTLLKKASKWLLKQEYDKNRFPTKIYTDGDTIKGLDLSWCYGNFSLATSFWICGHVLKDNILLNKSIEIVEDAATVSSLDYGIHYINNARNIFFCHGTSGIGYLFQKFYRLTGEKTFLTKSLEWYDLTRAEITKYDTEYLEDNYCLLDGCAGVLLAVASAEQNNTNWDQLFLLDLEKFKTL
jgi:lantibiotic modifying enzyme